MKFRFPLYRIRTAFDAWKNSDPKQAGRLGTVVKFFAVMLILTLTARGIAGASMPRVTLGQASAGSITQSSTASGTISVQGGTPLTAPEGLLVAQVTATTGQALSKGDAIARFDEVSLEQALATKQAQVKQLEVSAMQLSDPDKADSFALQQAQQQLERAYSDAQKTWQDGEDAIEKARQQRDAAQNALNALQNQPVATPESAEAERQQKIADAQVVLDAAESALAAAQESATAANKAAEDTAQSYEDARNSAAHNYNQSSEDIEKTNASNQAQAAVTQAQLDIARAELSALQELEAADGIFFSSYGWNTHAAESCGRAKQFICGRSSCRSERCQCTDLFFGAGVGSPCHGGNTGHCEARKSIYADNHYSFVRTIGRGKYTNYRHVKLRRMESGKCYCGNQTERRAVRTMPSSHRNSNRQLWYVCLFGGRAIHAVGYTECTDPTSGNG